MKLFLTAFLQVLLVSANTYFIAKIFYPGILIAAFLISFLWTYNVKKISIGTIKQRLIYSSGAMLGGVSGVYLSTLILN